MITRAHPKGFGIEWRDRLAEADEIIADLQREFAVNRERKAIVAQEVNHEISRIVAVLANIVRR